MKLAATPEIPALSSSAPSALRLRLGREHRAAHEARKVGALGDQIVEGLEGGGDLVGRLLVPGQREQGRGVAPRHSRNNVFLFSHVVRSLEIGAHPRAARGAAAVVLRDQPTRKASTRTAFGPKTRMAGRAAMTIRPRTSRRGLRNIGLLGAQPDLAVDSARFDTMRPRNSCSSRSPDRRRDRRPRRRASWRG